jgi:hypothetical protein
VDEENLGHVGGFQLVQFPPPLPLVHFQLVQLFLPSIGRKPILCWPWILRFVQKFPNNVTKVTMRSDHLARVSIDDSDLDLFLLLLVVALQRLELPVPTG